MTETAAGTLKYEYMKEYDSLTRREEEYSRISSKAIPTVI